MDVAGVSNTINIFDADNTRARDLIDANPVIALINYTSRALQAFRRSLVFRWFRKN